MPTRTQQSDILAAAHASHGDTRHVLLLPADPHECFEFAAAALDLADRLQTPVFLMTDLDIGMNQRLCKPLVWDDNRKYDHGKVMTAEMLEAGKEFGRYLDVDGDGIPYRTYPGTHETKGAYFTRGTSRNPYAQYSEAGPDYVYNMQRLQKKFEFAKTLLPKPVLTPAREPARFGAIYYGSTSPSKPRSASLSTRRAESAPRRRMWTTWSEAGAGGGPAATKRFQRVSAASAREASASRRPFCASKSSPCRPTSRACSTSPTRSRSCFSNASATYAGSRWS